ncbi:hypothetical protein ACWEQ1_12135 [Streptomyces nodosus]
MAPYFESGRFRPPAVGRRHDLDNGKDAYLAVANRARGRVVICP